jgi:hypothetical protein
MPPLTIELKLTLIAAAAVAAIKELVRTDQSNEA